MEKYVFGGNNFSGLLSFQLQAVFRGLSCADGFSVLSWGELRDTKLTQNSKLFLFVTFSFRQL